MAMRSSGAAGLILKFINPDVLAGTGCATVEDLSATPLWEETVRRNLQRSVSATPHQVVIVDRNGRIIGESP